MSNDDRFSGRVALVTGGASGIGEAVARRLASEGAAVASLDLQPASADGVLALAGDVSKSADVDAAVKRAEAELGPLDVLVCSAGVPGDSLPSLEISDAEWRRVLAINADGVFYCNRAAAPGMVERGYGRIVNVASIAGKEGNPMAAAYSASKAAVIALTKAIGKDLARTGVAVNCVAPAVIETPILEGVSRGAHRVHGGACPDGANGPRRRGRGSHLLAGERRVLVLDRGDVRHLGRAGGLLMRRVRVRGPNGVERGALNRGVIVTESGACMQALDAERLTLPDPYELLIPLEPPEVWCAGVTYERSRDARIEESAVEDVYSLVYDAERPELFLKDAGCRRTVGPGEAIGIRSDSAWNVPEPEIGLVLGEDGSIAGVTIGNDVSSREIEGTNPLYLPQAKVYAGACAIGPAVLSPVPTEHLEIRMRILDADGAELFAGETSTARMKRSFEELVEFLLRDNPVPAGSVLLTGTGLVPPDDFTLEVGHVVEIEVPEIGILSNPVVLASNLLERTSAHV